MDYGLLVFVFTIGVITEALLLSYNKKINLKRLREVFIVSVIVLLLAILEASSEIGLPAIFFLFVIIFSTFFAITFKNEILPVIHEGTVLSFTIVFWFVILENLNYFCMPLVIVALIATIGTMILTFTKIKIGFYASAFFYGWFLLVSLFLGVTQALYLFSGDSPISMVDAFLFGMLFLYLIAHYLYLYLIFSIPFPWPSTFSRDMESWKEDLQCFADRYSEHQVSLPVALSIIGIEGSAFLLNYIYNVVPIYFLIPLFIVILPQVASIMIRQEKSKKR